jgi:Zn-dependent protease with chaperone function
MAPNLYNNKSTNISKTFLIMGVFFVFVIGLGWAFSYIQNDPSILWIAVGFSLFMNIGSYWYSDKIALAVSGAKEADKEEYKKEREKAKTRLCGKCKKKLFDNSKSICYICKENELREKRHKAFLEKKTQVKPKKNLPFSPWI